MIAVHDKRKKKQKKLPTKKRQYCDFPDAKNNLSNTIILLGGSRDEIYPRRSSEVFPTIILYYPYMYCS